MRIELKSGGSEAGTKQNLKVVDGEATTICAAAQLGNRFVVVEFHDGSFPSERHGGGAAERIQDGDAALAQAVAGAGLQDDVLAAGFPR